MPALKTVSSLINLCIDKATELLIDSLGLSQKVVKKSTHRRRQLTVENNELKITASNIRDKKGQRSAVQEGKSSQDKENVTESLPAEASRGENHVAEQALAVTEDPQPQQESPVEGPAEGNTEEIPRWKKYEVVRRELSSALTCHSHAALHRHLFDVVSARLDPIYKREHHNKAATRACQDILAHFLNSSLRILDFEKTKMFSEAEMCKVLFENLHKAKKLEKLIIGRSCYWRSQIFEKLNTKLVHMPNLRVLKIQFICTPEMLLNLSQNCPQLCELSLRGSEKITDEECGEIAKCLGLVSLDISGTRITGRGCWNILESVKNLSWLHHCAFNCNSDSLLFESRAELFSYVKEQLRRGETATSLAERPDLSLRDTTFSLRNFWLFNPVSEDLLSTLLCPDLEHLRLDFIFQDMFEEPEVEVLSSIKKLERLEVNMYDRCSVDLVGSMLGACGHHLTSLTLHLADDWFFAAQVHNAVAANCHNLVELTFSGDYKARHTLEDCDNKLDFSIASPAHPQLQQLRLTGVASDQRLRFLLGHSPALRTLHMDGELEWLHDNTFTDLLTTNPLPDLEEIWFNVSTTVTFMTIRLLLQQENQLKVIGRLCHMDQSNMEEYQQLLAQVQHKNLNVKLIWVTDEWVKK